MILHVILHLDIETLQGVRPESDGCKTVRKHSDCEPGRNCSLRWFEIGIRLLLFGHSTFSGVTIRNEYY